MKFKAGDKVWALSKPSNEVGVPPGSYAGVVIEFMEAIDGIDGMKEFYNVEVADIPSKDGKGFVIVHTLLRHRDEPDDPPGDSDATPRKKTRWEDFKLWNPTKMTV